MQQIIDLQLYGLITLSLTFDQTADLQTPIFYDLPLWSYEP